MLYPIVPLDAWCDDLGILARQLIRRTEDIEAYEAKLAIAVGALKWYSEVAPQRIEEYGGGMNSIPKYEWSTDRGKRAREAIDRISSGNNKGDSK